MATQTIAVAGKGGVGKTTLCGFIIDYLYRKHNGPVLAVDADVISICWSWDVLRGVAAIAL